MLFIQPFGLDESSAVGQIITLLDHPRRNLAGAMCQKDGQLQIWTDEDSTPDQSKPSDCGRFNIEGLDSGRLTFNGTTLVVFDKWYTWGFHPYGVWICYKDRIDLVILSLKAS